MTKHKYDFKEENGKKKDALDAEFVNNEEKEQKEQTPQISFFTLYRFTTGWDKFMIFIGVLGAVGTGILQPVNIFLFGDLTGSIINYAQAQANYTNNVTQEEYDEATDQFMSDVAYFSTMNALVGLGMLAFSYLSTETFNYTSLRQIYKIRTLYLKKILEHDISWYDINESGDFASRMSDDLSKLEDGIGEKVPTFLNFQVTFVASLVLAFVKGWELALVCLTSLPLSMLAIGIIAILTSKLAKKELDAYGSAGSIAEEVMSTIRTVVAFGGQQKEIERYDKNLVFAKNNNIRRSFMTAFGFGLLWFFIYGSYALAFWYGVKLILNDRNESDPVYTPGNMVTVFFSVMTGSMNFGISSPFIESFATARAAGSKVFSVIDHIPIINLAKETGEKIEDLKGKITFKGVTFSYPSRKNVPVLQGLDLEINPGDTVALVGSSGCGKSTCVQLIQRFYDPHDGEVHLDGRNMKDLNLKWLRSNIGVVGQEPILFGTTIMENIRYGNRDASDDDIVIAAKKANAHDFIKALPNQYNTLVGERGAQLSGGQKQRIAIARALVRNPSILLLDEATSALDNTSEAKVQAAIDSVSKECTTIIVAHRLSTIRSANKIVVLLQGKVVEQGTHDELMELKNEYFNLVTAQVQSTIGLERSVSTMSDKEEDEDERRKSVLAQKEDEESSINDEVLRKQPSVWFVIQMNSKEWPQLLLASIGSVLMGCAMPLFAVLFGSIIGVLADTDEDYVKSKTNTYCIYFILAGVASGLSTFCQIYMFGVAGERLTMRIRSEMFRAMLRQEMGFFDRKENGVGALCAKLSGEAAQVQGATGQRLGTILQSIATLTLSVGLSMYYEWKLGFVALAFTPFILVATYLQRLQSRGDDDDHNNSLEKSTKVAVEAVSNIRTVVSLGCEETFSQLYDIELVPHLKKALRNSHGRALVLGLSRSLMFFAYSACMYYGSYLIRDGLYYDNVFKVSQALIMGTVSIANALAFTPNLQKGITAARNVNKLLNRIPKITDQPQATDMSSVTGQLEYNQIYFSYPTRESVMVLKGLDLSILEGKTVALVGPSGCGKSTIIQLIERFYDPASGTVALEHHDLRTIRLESLRSHLGIVSQEPNLFNRTIAENIAYGDNSRDASKDEIMQAARNANIHEFITKLPLGYDTSLGEKGTQLSGGQKQRIAIARALLRDPKVLLLDEATSALDTESEKVVQEALDKAKQGRTCITIAHRLTTIQDADVICVISDGVVAEMGTHPELLARKGLYYQLQKLQHK